MNWEQKYDALASMIEGYRHERNEALERVRLLEAEVERVNAREDATRRELYATCIDMRDMERERDEARAEVEALTDERDELLVRVANQDAELRATREAYRDAYRRGAEAMRDECIGAACGFYMGTTGFCNGDEDELEAVLEALPIPEEP